MKLNEITKFFEAKFLPDSTSQGDNEKATRLAAAALMVEVAEADFESKPEEQQALKEILKASFNLKEKDVDELVKLAESKYENATDSFEFTHLVNQHFSLQQKLKLIDQLWQVAYADKVLDKYEEQVIRRISELIYVSHKDYIASKLKHKESPD